MLNIWKMILMVAFTLAAAHATAADALSCRQVYSQSEFAQTTQSNRIFNSFADVTEMSSIDAIWAQAKKELMAEISSLPRSEQAQIQRAAEGIQNYIDVLSGRSIKWKKANGTKENYLVYDYRGRMDDLKEDLRVGLNTHSYGTHGYAVGIYRSLFHNVESSYLRLTENLAEMSALEKYGRNVEEIQKQSSLGGRAKDFISEKLWGAKARERLEQLRLENRKHFRILGRGIEEYTIVRLYLESIAKEDPVLMADPVFSEIGQNGKPLTPPAEIAAYARNILSHLGVTGVQRRSPLVQSREQRISLEELQSLMIRTPEIQIEKLQYEARSNRDIFIRSTAVIVLGNYIRKIVIKFPREGKFRFLRQSLDMMTGLIEKRYIEHRYLPQIRDIIYAENDLRTQYEILRRQHDAEEMTDEFLVAFARISYYSSHWSNLKKYAEKVANETQNTVDADFFERMKKAESEAIKASTFSPGKTDAKAALMKAGSVTITAVLFGYYFDNITSGLMSAMGLATEAAKFVCTSCGL